MQPTTAVLPRYADWLTTDQVAEQVGVSSIVVNNWIMIGIKTDSGRIRLGSQAGDGRGAVKVGGRWKIDPAAVKSFIEATTVAALPASATSPASVPTIPKLETEAARDRRAERCIAELREMGIGAPPQRRPRKAK